MPRLLTFPLWKGPIWVEVAMKYQTCQMLNINILHCWTVVMDQYSAVVVMGPILLQTSVSSIQVLSGLTLKRLCRTIENLPVLHNSVMAVTGSPEEGGMNVFVVSMSGT